MAAPPSGPSRAGDLLAAAILLALALLLRLPTLDRVALNPDESQYAATAAYLVATGGSAFSLVYGTPWTYALYEVLGRLFGPYEMAPVRLLVLAICLGMAFGLYRLVARRTTWGWGVFGAVVFLHYNLFCEGLTANREWFASACLLGGIGLAASALEQGRGRGRLQLAAAGLVAGLALCFKEQSAYMILALPALLAWLALERRDLREGLGRLLAWSSGGLLALAVYFAPFAVVGSLRTYLAWIGISWESYVGANQQTTHLAAQPFFEYFRWFYRDRPDPTLLAVAYGFAAIAVTGALARALGRREPPLPLVGHPTVLAFVAWLLTGFMAIQMGGLFFDHYYLFLVAPLSALVAFAGHAFSVGRRSAPIRAMAGLGVGFLLLQRYLMLSGRTPDALREYWPGAAASMLFVAAGLGLLLLRGLRLVRSTALVLVALVVLDGGLLAVQAQSARRPRDLPFDERGFPDLVRWLETQAGAGDRLFVWGWRPEIYALSRIEPASHLVVCQYLVQDYRVVPAPSIDREMERQLMLDLERRKPRFIVDASRRSWTMEASGNPWVYWLDLYPDFEFVDYLKRGYDQLATLDDCDVYVRRPDEIPATPAP